MHCVRAFVHSFSLYDDSFRFFAASKGKNVKNILITTKKVVYYVLSMTAIPRCELQREIAHAVQQEDSDTSHMWSLQRCHTASLFVRILFCANIPSHWSLYDARKRKADAIQSQPVNSKMFSLWALVLHYYCCSRFATHKIFCRHNQMALSVPLFLSIHLSSSARFTLHIIAQPNRADFNCIFDFSRTYPFDSSQRQERTHILTTQTWQFQHFELRIECELQCLLSPGASHWIMKNSFTFWKRDTPWKQEKRWKESNLLRK